MAAWRFDPGTGPALRSLMAVRLLLSTPPSPLVAHLTVYSQMELRRGRTVLYRSACIGADGTRKDGLLAVDAIGDGDELSMVVVRSDPARRSCGWQSLPQVRWLWQE